MCNITFTLYYLCVILLYAILPICNITYVQYYLYAILPMCNINSI